MAFQVEETGILLRGCVFRKKCLMNIKIRKLHIMVRI